MKVQPSTIIVTLLFYPVFLGISLTIIFRLALTGIVLRPFLTHRQTQRMIRYYIFFYGKIAVRLGFPWVRIRYEDLDKEHPNPCIYVCNHRSFSDAFFMVTAVLLGEIVQVVNTWPFKIPIIGVFARLAGYLSVKQMPFELFQKQGEELLAQGVSLLGFPEGTRSINMKMGPFHSAMFRLALASKVPIVPVCLSGTERVPPKGVLWIYPSHVRVRKLPAITYHAYKEMSPFKLKNYVHGLIEQELLTMDR